MKGSEKMNEEMNEEIQTDVIAALIEWLKAHGKNDAEIVDCLEYISKSR